MIEKIIYNMTLFAIIIRANYCENGINFFTDSTFSQQLAFMKHPRGKLIQAHIHQPNQREVIHTQEVLVIRKGSVRVDLYSSEKQYLESHILRAGDVILLASGGHGFEVLEDLEMFEIKQGPFVGIEDKVRFDGVATINVKIVEENKNATATNTEKIAFNENTSSC